MKFNGPKVFTMFKGALVIAPLVIIVLSVIDYFTDIGLDPIVFLNDIPFLQDKTQLQWIVVALLIPVVGGLLAGLGFGSKRLFNKYKR